MSGIRGFTTRGPANFLPAATKIKGLGEIVDGGVPWSLYMATDGTGL